MYVEQKIIKTRLQFRLKVREANGNYPSTERLNSFAKMARKEEDES